MTLRHDLANSKDVEPFLVLVVDDEVTMRRSIADILRLEGYRVQMAGNGEEAIQCLKNESYDLILLDLKMPGISGVDVLRFASEISPETQIILLTAHGSMESAIEALRHGAQDYLLKPSSPETILASVAKALKARADYLQRQRLLSQLEASVQALKGNKETNPQPLPRRDEKVIGNGVCVDFNRQMLWKDNVRVSLTSAETKLLKVLLENQGVVFTHQELVFKVQGYNTTQKEAPGVLRPLVSRLRRKLAKFTGMQDLIVSVRGKGYMFNPDQLLLDTAILNET